MSSGLWVYRQWRSDQYHVESGTERVHVFIPLEVQQLHPIVKCGQMHGFKSHQVIQGWGVPSL